MVYICLHNDILLAGHWSGSQLLFFTLFCIWAGKDRWSLTFNMSLFCLWAVLSHRLKRYPHLSLFQHFHLEVCIGSWVTQCGARNKLHLLDRSVNWLWNFSLEPWVFWLTTLGCKKNPAQDSNFFPPMIITAFLVECFHCPSSKLIVFDYLNKLHHNLSSSQGGFQCTDLGLSCLNQN